MSDKKIYSRFCKRCKNYFPSENGRAYICPACKRENKLRLARERYGDFKKPRAERKSISDNSINDFVLLLEEYNRRNNTNYSYGKFELELNLGRISIAKLFH